MFFEESLFLEDLLVLLDRKEVEEDRGFEED